MTKTYRHADVTLIVSETGWSLRYDDFGPMFQRCLPSDILARQTLENRLRPSIKDRLSIHVEKHENENLEFDHMMIRAAHALINGEI